MNKKRIVIASLIVVSFILLVLSVILYIDRTRELRRIDPLELESLSKEQIIQSIYERQAEGTLPFFYFIPIFAFFGIAIGALMYYILGGEIERKEKIIEYDTKVILKLLNPDERRVIEKIVESQGKVQQMEITYLEGFTKVKSHRVLESLVGKGILSKEKMGKMRLIRMNKDFYDILKER
ncbi:MAG: hypothetical protein V1866_06090 [archaeon]